MGRNKKHPRRRPQTTNTDSIADLYQDEDEILNSRNKGTGKTRKFISWYKALLFMFDDTNSTTTDITRAIRMTSSAPARQVQSESYVIKKAIVLNSAAVLMLGAVRQTMLSGRQLRK